MTESKMQKQLMEQTLSREQFAVSKYISTLRFRPKLFGVDEDGVWRAMERLVILYEDALLTERAKRELAERKLEALRSREEEPHG